MKVWTIGYEAATQDDVVAALASAGVERLIDVRQLPLSRRPGFSKTPLSAALAEAGIGYVHMKALGTPPAGREASRKARHGEMAAIYRAALAEPAAIVAAAQLRELVDEKPSALLCFEREPTHCHRQVLIDETLAEAEVTHLYP